MGRGQLRTLEEWGIRINIVEPENGVTLLEKPPLQTDEFGWASVNQLPVKPCAPATTRQPLRQLRLSTTRWGAAGKRHL